MMEVYIETLTGTAFELRVSPFETVMSVKAKIQRLEGIPISQQHLIWQSKELEDENCLHDYSITDGCTLKLVLAMRGGPINTRRIPVEDPAIREMAEYMEANKDEIWEKLPGNHQVTLLVFREGDQINFFRVVDKGDGTLTPLTESISGESVYNLCDEENDEEIALHETRSQNDITMKKMETLREQMAVLNLNKKPKKKNVPGPSTKVISRTHHPKLRSQIFSKIPCLPPVKNQDSLFSANIDTNESSGSNRKLEASVELESKSDSSNSSEELRNACAATSHSPSDSSCFSFPQIPILKHPQTKLESLGLHPHLQQSLARLECGGGSIALNNFRPVISSRVSGLEPHHHHHSSEPLQNFRNNLHSVSPKNTNLDRRKDAKTSVEAKSNIRHQEWRTSRNSECSGTTDMIYTPHVIKNLPLDRFVSKETWKLSPLLHSSGTRENLECSSSGPASREGKRSTPDKLLLRTQRLSFSQDGHSSPTLLPAMKLKKSNKRCCQCGKKTGLATSYMCRCGNNFCAGHRYAESHSCSYDYKAEGRKLLEQTNPVVLAPKLPKI